jgi:phosphopantothenoylcysteine decarboxylase/phosphopantothenate--cysteine ligase
VDAAEEIMLAGRRILLGVTGSIAAYQATDLIGLLKVQLADVRVIMTPAATRFITPLTLAVVSGHPVTVDMFDAAGDVVEHIALAQAADLLLVAPASANIIGKMASGIADDMLSTTALAVTAPRLVAPAMNERMWLNPIVRANVRKLRRFGFRIVEPEYGAMACGGEGWGRLARLDTIVAEASAAVVARATIPSSVSVLS